MPLRVLVLSDLHVDYPQNRPRVKKWVQDARQHEADVFVLAGDVSHKLVDLEATLKEFDPLDCPKLFVAGNHDVWIVRPGREPVEDSWQKRHRVNDLAEQAGFTCLERKNARIGDFTFVGSMGWYDYSYASPALPFGPAEYARKQWQDLTYMDRDYARWGMEDAHVVDRMLSELDLRLRIAARPVVFVSHHVPRQDWVLRRGHPSWDFFNAYMGSQKLEARLAKEGVTRFVFGHTHRPVTLVEEGRCVINNPLGYPRQALTPLSQPLSIT